MKISRIRDERAQAVVEPAKIIPFLTLPLLAFVDFARFLYYDSSTGNPADRGIVRGLERQHTVRFLTSACGAGATAGGGSVGTQLIQ